MIWNALYSYHFEKLIKTCQGKNVGSPEINASPKHTLLANGQGHTLEFYSHSQDARSLMNSFMQTRHQFLSENFILHSI